MRVRMTQLAEQDVVRAINFYERRHPGFGEHLLEGIAVDLRRLRACAGVHAQVADGYHRMPIRRFSFAIYYRMDADLATVVAVLDCRRNPTRLASILRARRRSGP